jgi:hypothetical protein
MWKQWIRSHLGALTVDPNIYPGYEDHAIQPPVIVHNPGDATAEHCVVKVTNMRNQEQFERPDVFSVSPGQDYLQRLAQPTAPHLCTFTWFGASSCPYLPECVEWVFSEVRHSPHPMLQSFLCRVSDVRSPAYIRHLSRPG